jgi:1,4-dihydroxy-2-naphthoyl-CoA synthase
MNEVLTENSGSILRVTLNRPAKKNAMTSSMYTAMAKIFENAAKDDIVTSCTRRSRRNSNCPLSISASFRSLDSAGPCPRVADSFELPN